MSKTCILTILALALIVGLAAVTVLARAETAVGNDIYFKATGLTPEMQGTAPGQIDPHGAEFYNGSLVVVEPNSTISAFTLPFTDTTRVWVEYRNMPYTVTVYFNSVEGYGLGSCEIGSAGTAKLWGYCDHDPLGDYAAAEVIVAAPQGASIYGIVAARPQSWESPKHQIFVPVVSRGD